MLPNKDISGLPHSLVPSNCPITSDPFLASAMFLVAKITNSKFSDIEAHKQMLLNSDKMANILTKLCCGIFYID